MKLSTEQITEKLSSQAGWEYLNGQLQKTFILKDSETARKLVNQVTMAAEGLNHHPDVEESGNSVTFELSTHSENGVTEKDFALAEEIDSAASILS